MAQRKLCDRILRIETANNIYYLDPISDSGKNRVGEIKWFHEKSGWNPSNGSMHDSKTLLEKLCNPQVVAITTTQETEGVICAPFESMSWVSSKDKEKE